MNLKTELSKLSRIGHYVNGSLYAGNCSELSPIYHPATGDIRAAVEMANSKDVDYAVEAAIAAFPEWASSPAHVRARVMFRLRELIEENTEKLAGLINKEHGKVLSDARGEVSRGLEVVEFACSAPSLLKGDFSENVARGVDSVAQRQPLGVVAGITPFNFPAMVPMWMFPVALVCGNCFILKVSEKVPSAAMLLAELVKKAGCPDGVFNVINGGRGAVDALVEHPGIQAISFVGSTPIAKSIYERASNKGKRVQALGGAKNHMVIMPDADLDMVIDALIGSAFGSAGERCMAISVAVPVGEETANKLVNKLKERIKALKIGSGLDETHEMGPLVTEEHKEKVTTYINIGVSEGAELVVDGREFRPAEKSEGFYLGGTLFDRVQPSMRIYKEEIFGPVLSIVRCANFADALQLVNEHQFANGATIMTNDGGTARTFMNGVNTGMVGVNVPIPVPMAFHSFGGWKNSLFGDHHIHGMEGVRFFTRLKTSTVRWPKGDFQGADFGMPVNR